MARRLRKFETIISITNQSDNFLHMRPLVIAAETDSIQCPGIPVRDQLAMTVDSAPNRHRRMHVISPVTKTDALVLPPLANAPFPRIPACIRLPVSESGI